MRAFVFGGTNICYLKVDCKQKQYLCAVKGNGKERTEIDQLGEFGLIDHLTRDFAVNHAETHYGIGDDAAVLGKGSTKTLISTDLLVEGIHFDLMYYPLKHLGYKAVVVNLSDICAMNAMPAQITVSVAISNRFSVEALEEIYSGIRQACKHYRVDLIGGDTTSSLSGLAISVTAIGYSPKDSIAYRNGAQEGELICVSGDLGGAYLGLQVLEREKQIFLEHPEVQPELKDESYVVGKQLKPEARTDLIAFFAKQQIVPSAMIDVSDGLASDLMHICTQSDLGCMLYEDRLPIAQQTFDQGMTFHIDPTVCALNGGEDYELLFTIAPDKAPLTQLAAEGISVIGEMKSKDSAYKLKSKRGQVVDLAAQGWNHFKQ